MTREQIKALFPQASEDTIRKTLAYYAHQPMARLGSPKPKQDQRSKSEDQRLGTGPPRFRFVVGIVSHRKRKLDGHDNLRTAHKALVDRITERLGFDSDDQPNLEWEYAQVVTKGRPGTHLTITTYSPG